MVARVFRLTPILSLTSNVQHSITSMIRTDGLLRVVDLWNVRSTWNKARGNLPVSPHLRVSTSPANLLGSIVYTASTDSNRIPCDVKKVVSHS
ncbi:hypothetical protein TMatcc_000141 [Talaromyces marneffei ATCC 18224]